MLERSDDCSRCNEVARRSLIVLALASLVPASGCSGAVGGFPRPASDASSGDDGAGQGDASQVPEAAQGLEDAGGVDGGGVDAAGDAGLEGAVSGEGSVKDATANVRCPQAVGAWAAEMPPYGSTSYLVTFRISEEVAAVGGAVDVTWTSPGVNTYTGAGVFAVDTCELVESYPVLCASSIAAGNGVQCGDTNSAGRMFVRGGMG